MRAFVRFQPLLFQPVEALTPFSFSALTEECRSAWFPEIEDQVEVRIGAHGPLAFIQPDAMGRRRHVVVFHPILNQPGVPEPVVRFIAKHELTHIVRPPRTREVAEGSRIRTYYNPHPPEFWQHEVHVGPERFAVWSWIHRNFGRALRHQSSGLVVLSSWRNRLPETFSGYTLHLPFHDVPWRDLCPAGGAQLRLPPDWPPSPHPLAATAVV